LRHERSGERAGSGVLPPNRGGGALRTLIVRPRTRYLSLEVTGTERLVLRWIDAGDAAFLFELVNDPSWIQYIGDKGVRTLEDAQRYIQNGPLDMYKRLGFGLYLVELKETGERIGICGLIKRGALEHVDLGFAFLPRFWRNGYALESAAAVMSYGRRMLGLSQIVAVLSHDNRRSCKLLEKLGFRFQRKVRLQANGEELDLYVAAA
jgi:RimJ/RimL family protein N-acetyltransferase